MAVGFQKLWSRDTTKANQANSRTMAKSHLRQLILNFTHHMYATRSYPLNTLAAPRQQCWWSCTPALLGLAILSQMIDHNFCVCAHTA
jgi:hypothetical protein